MIPTSDLVEKWIEDNHVCFCQSEAHVNKVLYFAHRKSFN